MKILTWNIQATKGCDGSYDASRIIRCIHNFDDLDVICLQEVSRYIPDQNSDDQPALLGESFPDHEAVWGPGFSVSNSDGTRSEFGNLTLVKRNILKNHRVHCLPSPRLEGVLQTPRTMVEVLVDASDCPVTVFNAHLAFHSRIERVQQIQALTSLRDQIDAKVEAVPVTGAWGPYNYTDSSRGVILCGDLNVDSDTDEFRTYITDENWIDCWSEQKMIATARQASRQPTCGCFDQVQWPEGPHVRDYFLATGCIARQTVRVEVDTDTDASDHQPVFLEIAL